MAGLIRAVPAILVPLLLLAGCATKDDLLPQAGPTMREVYDQHFEARRRAADPATALGGRGAGQEADLTGYARDAATEIDNRFPRLPNPDLVMYVFPHLSDKGYPVPGYSTVLPMYETVEYALPGEKEGW